MAIAEGGGGGTNKSPGAGGLDRARPPAPRTPQSALQQRRRLSLQQYQQRRQRREGGDQEGLAKRRSGSATVGRSGGSGGGSGGGTMDYAWMEPKHDPIATDTNLAEIDFEDFRNEDLAYAFSCGVSEICRPSHFRRTMRRPNSPNRQIECCNVFAWPSLPRLHQVRDLVMAP